MKQSWAVDLTGFDWSQRRWASGLRRLPAVVLCLGLGFLLRQPLAGVVAAGAALSTGLAAFRSIGGSRARPLCWTPAAIAFSAWIGTLAGNSPWLGPAVTALWGVLFALLTIHDEQRGWIAMQAAIGLVIATAFPSHGIAALERAAAIAAGGAVQIVLLLALWRLQGISVRGGEEPGADDAQPPVQGPGLPWSWTRSIAPGSLAARYALRVALTLVAATEIARHLPLQNGYWLPMTTIVVLKPDFYRTYTGGVQRVAGTLLGVVAASLIAHFFHPHQFWLVGLVGLFAFLSFTLLKVSSTVFAATLTAYVVFLISTAGLPTADVTLHRLVNTALGCGLAMASRLIGFRGLRHWLAHARTFPRAPVGLPPENPGLR